MGAVLITLSFLIGHTTDEHNTPANSAEATPFTLPLHQDSTDAFTGQGIIYLGGSRSWMILYFLEGGGGGGVVFLVHKHA